jgi:hypothetical protein
MIVCSWRCVRGLTAPTQQFNRYLLQAASQRGRILGHKGTQRETLLTNASFEILVFFCG